MKKTLAALAALITVLALAGTATAAPSTANLWVDTDGGSCTRSGTATAYATSSACGSFDAAYDAAQAGDTVVVKSGAYASQDVTGTKSSPGVSFIGESGTTVSAIATHGDWFSLSYVDVETGSAHGALGWSGDADHVSFDHVNLHGSYVSAYLESSTYLSWTNSELGTAGRTGGARVCGSDHEPLTFDGVQHVTIDAVSFHPQDADHTPSGCSANGFHLELIRIDGGTSDLTVRNSTFDSGDHSGTATIFITEPGGYTDPHDLTFENNFFGTTDASSGAFASHANVTTCQDIRIAYNTFLSHGGAWECTSTSNFTWVGNLGPSVPSGPCLGTYSHNVWQDSSVSQCDPSDTPVIGTRWGTEALGLTGDGFHLASTSPALGAGDPLDCPATDHDGDARPVGACDAGADEYAGAPTDFTAPTVGLTAPAAASTVSGSISVTASAADNVGVVGVRFLLDGAPLGSEVASAPHAVTWNTATASNGSHTLTAIARDAAGNETTSTAVRVTVDNSPATTLLGSTSIFTVVDTNGTGRAEAFKTTSLAAGTLTKLKFYLDSSSTASSVMVGLYTNSSNHPVTLLTQGTASSPTPGAWNTVTVPSTSISARTTYWIALLAPVGSSGTIQFSVSSAVGVAETSSSGTLSALPARWSRQTIYSTGPLSGYGTT